MGNKEIKNILVTGGGGFVGLALVKHLAKSGYNVSSFSRKQYSVHQQLGIKSITGDLTDLNSVIDACKNVDAIFHVGANVSMWGDYNDFYLTNVIGTQNVIQGCLRNEINYLIHTSSASVVFNGIELCGVDESYPIPKSFLSNYTRSKAEAEKLMNIANCNELKTITLRPHLIWGPGDNQLIPKIVARAKTGKMFRIGKRHCLVDTVFIDNLVDAYMLALKKIQFDPQVTGKAFFITNDEPIEVWQFINSILRIHHIQSIDKHIPKWIALVIVRALEWAAWVTGKPPLITRFIIEELSTNHYFNIDAAKTELGYTATINIEQGLERLKNT